MSQVNQDALSIAKDRDAEQQAGQLRSELHGIPIFIKNVFLTQDDLCTTGEFEQSLVTSYTETKPASWVLWPYRCKVYRRIDRGDQITRCWGSTTGRYCWFRMALWSRCRQSPQWVVCCWRSRKRHFSSESRSPGIFDRKLFGCSIRSCTYGSGYRGIFYSVADTYDLVLRTAVLDFRKYRCTSASSWCRWY